VYLAGVRFGFRLANVDDGYIPLRQVVGPCVQDVGTTQIAFSLLGLPKNVTEVAVGFKRLSGEEVRGAAD